MEITYVVIITLVTYVLGSITKVFINNIPNKYIPLQNVIIGLISAAICYFTKIETNLLQSIVLCLMATMGAGGIADLMKIGKKENDINEMQSVK